MSEVRKRKDGEEKTPDSADSDPVSDLVFSVSCIQDVHVFPEISLIIHY